MGDDVAVNGVVVDDKENGENTKKRKGPMMMRMRGTVICPWMQRS